jgi:hypothetical protein
MKRRICIIVILFLLGCKNTSNQYLVLSYEDFGPQVLSYETIGMQWWQWDNHGDSNPKTKYDIKIVVYRDIPLKKIKSIFPVNEEEKKDFRYIEYFQSIKLIEKNIKVQGDINEDWAKKLKERLIKTKNKIIQNFKNTN